MRLRPLPWLLGSAAAALCFAEPAAAQAVNLSQKAASEHAAERAAGSYAGVKPGGNQTPSVDVKPGTTPATVTWPGFQMQPDGSSRVFLQTSAPVLTDSRTVGRTIVVDLGDVKMVGHTNRLPLYTQYFNTPVTIVELKRDKNRTLLLVQLRANVQARISTEQAQSGFYFVYLDFPPGQYLSGKAPALPQAAATPAPPPEPQQNVLNEPPPMPQSLDGEVNAQGNVTTPSARANAAMNAELPPGMGKTKAKAGGKLSIGR